MTEFSKKATALARFGLAAGLLASLGLCAGCAGNAKANDDPEDMVTCPEPTADAIRFPDAKLFFEHNATDGDTGLQGLFDAEGWSKLCLYDPTGAQLLGIKPMGAFGRLGMAELFFESREPPHDVVPVAEHLANYPEGEYSLRGVTFDGKTMTGTASLTHDIPVGPVITAPADDSTVPPSGLVISWEPVTETIAGNPVEISGYELIVTNEERDDPNGFAVADYKVHVPPATTSMPVPDEFLEPGTVYEVEVLAIEASGNQTITAIVFQTE